MMRCFIILAFAATLFGCASTRETPVNEAKNAPADTIAALQAKEQENQALAQQLDAMRAEVIQETVANQREKEDLARQLEDALAQTSRQKQPQGRSEPRSPSRIDRAL